MKRFGLVCLVLLMMVSVFGVAGAAKKPMVLKLGHYAAPGHPGDLAAKMFAENVENRTNGEIRVEVYPNNELGDPPELLEQNILGVIDMSLPTQGALDKYSKKFAVVMLPFIYEDYEHAYKVLDGPFMEWAAPDLEDQGLIFLSNWEWGFRNVTNSVRPINAPEDMKGLKLRTPPEIQLQVAMEACGAVVAKIDFSELYMSLKQGVVDGQENPLSVIYHNKVYEAQKYLALTKHVYNSMVHVMSKKTWEKLSSTQKQVILEESKAAANFMREKMQAEEADLIQKLKDEGMLITTPDISKFKEAMGPAYDLIGDYAGKENVEKFLQMVESAK